MSEQRWMNRTMTAACIVGLACILVRCSPEGGSGGGVSGDDPFAGASLPTPAVADLEETADGVRYVRGALLVVGEAAEDAVLAHGGAVTGGIPKLQIVYASFDAEGDEALTAIADAVAAETGVEAVSRDWANGQLTEEREVTDSEKLGPDEQVASDLSGTWQNVPLGVDGLWAYEYIDVFGAWDAIHDANPVTMPVRIAVVDDLLTTSGVFGDKIADRADMRLDYEYTVGGTQHAHRVASIIGAPDDGTGMTGIVAGLDCIEYELIPVAVMGSVDDAQGNYDHVTSISVILSGLIYSIQAGARVVNMSFSGESNDAGSAKVYELVFKAAPWVLFVASAGNDGLDAGGHQPASVVLSGVGNLVSVGAIGRAGGNAVWPHGAATNVATTPGSVTLAAPGTDVLSTAPAGNLEFFWGTSASAPVVSGVAGLMFAVNPELSGSQVRQKLISSGRSGISTLLGGRAVDAAAAVSSAIADVPSMYLGEGTCREEEDPNLGPCDEPNRQCHPGMLVSTCDPGDVCDEECQCYDPGLPKSCSMTCGDDDECPSVGGFGHCYKGRCVSGSCRSDADCAELGTVGTLCARRGNKTNCVHPCGSHEDCPDDVLDQACVSDSDGMKHCYFVSELCSDCPDDFICNGGSGVCQCTSSDQCAEDIPCQ